MSKIRIMGGEPFTEVVVSANGKTITLAKVLIDTGSAGTLFKTEDMRQLGIVLELTDKVVAMSGIGGGEYVVEKQVDSLQVGNLVVSPFTIQMGAVEYGIPMDGILGADFLLQTGAVLDFKKLEIRQ
jgi:predicted aspartyl protease